MTLAESFLEDAVPTRFGELGYTCLGAEARTLALFNEESEPYRKMERIGRLCDASGLPIPTPPKFRDLAAPLWLRGGSVQIQKRIE
jgi:hypothetical protein